MFDYSIMTNYYPNQFISIDSKFFNDFPLLRHLSIIVVFNLTKTTNLGWKKKLEIEICL